MSSAQERAAEVIRSMFQFANPRWQHNAAQALAEANLLVDDDTARLVALGKAVEGLDPARWRWTRLVIYREAGVESPTWPETPPDGTPSEGDTAPVSGGAG